MATLSRALLFLAPLLLGSTRAEAQGRVQADIQRALTELQVEDRVQRTLGAIAAQHVVKGRWRFSLLDRTELRWWQRDLEPAIPHLVQLLDDDSGLEWIDGNGMTERVTTPRKEATLALVGLERASIGPLIAALDRPGLTRKADLVLREIVGRGPAGADQASWRAWWQAHGSEPLPREHGQLWKAALAVLALGGGLSLVIWRQRKAAAAA